MIHIIGGAKTGYNLYSCLKQSGIESVLYYFAGEYSKNKPGCAPFKSEMIDRCVAANIRNSVIVSSETGFSRLPKDLRSYFDHHYYLRNKANLSEIATDIGVCTIPNIDTHDNESIVFPIILKRLTPDKINVPFKFRIIRNNNDLNLARRYFDICAIQPYFDPADYEQIAVAGFFNGQPESMISVQQLNQYPLGVSSYVKHIESNDSNIIIHLVADYLKNIHYQGFVEFEFMKEKKSKNYFLMDINPRPWGWFYYYMQALTNLKAVVLSGATPRLDIKAAWVNVPRLAMSFVNGRFGRPQIKDIIQRKICYEPYP